MKNFTFYLALFLAYLSYAQPTSNAPDPTKLAEDVVSVYSSTYTNIATNYDPFWAQAGAGMVNTNFDPGTGSFVLAYPTFNYQGTELTTTNLAGMEYLHIDIWVPSGTMRQVKVSPINNPSGTGVGEVLVEVPVTPGSWNSVDLAKSAFTGMTWDAVFQMKFDGQFNADGSANTTDTFDVYLDNIYFWRNPVANGSDATLSDLKIDGTSIANFSGATTTYAYGVPEGTTVVPQITSTTTTDSNATVTATNQATSVPGTATVMVTAQNGTDTEMYTINIVINSPVSNAATPTKPAVDVVSIYSDAYTNIATNYDPFWAQSGAGLVNATYNPGSGDMLLAYPNFNYQGTELTTTDASDMEFLHVDIWVPSGTMRQVKVSPINNSSGTGAGEFLVEVPITAGSWKSVDLPKSAFTGMTWDAVFQFKVDGQFNTDGSANTSESFDIYLDNIYFWKSSLSIASVDGASKISNGPNPTEGDWGVRANSTILSIEIINLLGQSVLSVSPNASDANIDCSELQPGLYIVNVVTVKGKHSMKLGVN